MSAERDPKGFVGSFELDYFQRARPFRRLKWWLSIAAFLISLGIVTAMVARPAWHTAFQAGPVSHFHRQFGVDCAACHDRAFATAQRLLPSSEASSVSEGKCLACHDAGRHDPNQLKHIGENGQAASCTECHKEHRGEWLAKLPDAVCTSCHGDLKTSSGIAHYATNIKHFASGHPEFGHWRKAPLTDPAGGNFQFNHKRHLELAQNYSEVSPKGRESIVKEFEQLKKLECVYCHQTDPDGRRMMPISYQNHCATCHPLLVQPMPASAMPAEAAARFARDPLSHPSPGESAGKIRASLLERYLRDEFQPRGATAATAVEPSILRSTEDPKALSERERLAMTRTRETEKQLFDQKGVGCLLCHVETNRVDGLPTIAPPHQQVGRWKEVIQNWPAERLRSPTYADAANRWFPLARFDHASHRMMTCTDCHGRAQLSQLTSDVLVPTKTQCLSCHHQGAEAAWSDCLTCHQYHDRSQHQAIRFATPDAINRTLKQPQSEAKQ